MAIWGHMHAYGTDSAERRVVPLLLASIAIVGALLLSRGIERLGWEIPWWADAPSVMSLYGLLHATFDRHVWRIGLLRRTGLIRVPDLNGSWKVRIKSSHDGKELEANITVHQTWRGMNIRLKTDQSQSSSLIASLLTSDPNEFVLSYEYLNTPGHGAVATMHMHRGSAEIRFARDATLVSGNGEYYSGRDRANQGSLALERM